MVISNWLGAGERPLIKQRWIPSLCLSGPAALRVVGVCKEHSPGSHSLFQSLPEIDTILVLHPHSGQPLTVFFRILH